jgi:hypothetical protein
MSTASNTSPNLSSTGICISHIIFDDTDNITLWAKTRIGGQLQTVHLVANVATLNDMLRYSGTKGEQILLAMADAIIQNENPPYVVALKQLLGHDAVLTSCKLHLIKAEDVIPETMPENTPSCWWIEQVTPLTVVAQAQHLNQHIKDFGDADVINVVSAHYKLNVTQLAKQYQYYLGLLELDINDDAAREKSGLMDERLFTVASLI